MALVGLFDRVGLFDCCSVSLSDHELKFIETRTESKIFKFSKNQKKITALRIV